MPRPPPKGSVHHDVDDDTCLLFHLLFALEPRQTAHRLELPMMVSAYVAWLAMDEIGVFRQLSGLSQLKGTQE